MEQSEKMMVDTRIILSAVWGALMLIYLLGDVLRLYSGDFMPGGELGGRPVSPELWMAAQFRKCCPLVFSKIASLILAIFLMKMHRLPLPKLIRSPIAILTGFLDTGGSILYLIATQFIRLDIGALLSSLYLRKPCYCLICS